MNPDDELKKMIDALNEASKKIAEHLPKIELHNNLSFARPPEFNPGNPDLLRKYLKDEIQPRRDEKKKISLPKKKLTRIENLEEKIPDKVAKWEKGKDKIGCAAFCMLLLNVFYIWGDPEKVTQRVKKLSDLAYDRYNKIDIKNELGFSKEMNERRKMPEDRLLKILKSG